MRGANWLMFELMKAFALDTARKFINVVKKAHQNVDIDRLCSLLMCITLLMNAFDALMS
jgi:hypothetical protein